MELETNPPGRRLAQGELWPRVTAVARQALDSGALQPIDTERLTLADGGVDFAVWVVAGLRRKDEAGRRLAAASRDDRNPFLPCDPALTVGDVGASHIAVLNKYRVVADHVLLITRAFEHQRVLLGAADFAAAWWCLREGDGLVFYNGGQAAGASQPHKHLQLVPLPLPLAGPGPGLPVAPLLAPWTPAAEPGTSPRLPFAHALAATDDLFARAAADPAAAGAACARRFDALRAAVGLEALAGGRQSMPYNLLLTRRLMLLVPRSVEDVAGIPINALGYAGSLLLRRRAQLADLERIGPLELLRRAGRSIGCSTARAGAPSAAGSGSGRHHSR